MPGSPPRDIRMNIIHALFEKYKFIRRAIVIWACWLITVVVLRVTEPDVIPWVNGAMATIVTGVIGILATVIAFYQGSRDKDREDVKSN